MPPSVSNKSPISRAVERFLSCLSRAAGALPSHPSRHLSSLPPRRSCRPSTAGASRPPRGRRPLPHSPSPVLTLSLCRVRHLQSTLASLSFDSFHSSREGGLVRCRTAVPRVPTAGKELAGGSSSRPDLLPPCLTKLPWPPPPPPERTTRPRSTPPGDASATPSLLPPSPPPRAASSRLSLQPCSIPVNQLPSDSAVTWLYESKKGWHKLEKERGDEVSGIPDLMNDLNGLPLSMQPQTERSLLLLNMRCCKRK